MNAIKEYIEKLRESMEIITSPPTATASSALPPLLRNFYSEFNSLETSFGEIYPLEITLRDMENEPFYEDGWIAFGWDGYFIYWLCKADNSGFTLYDHEWDEVIDDAWLFSIEELLEYCRKEKEND